MKMGYIEWGWVQKRRFGQGVGGDIEEKNAEPLYLQYGDIIVNIKNTM